MVELTKPDWSSRLMRLDPNQLPHSVSLEGLGQRSRRFSFELDRNGARLNQVVDCEPCVSTTLPNTDFKGIAARTISGENQQTIFTLELHHPNPDLCVPVLVADNLDDIAADWHTWSKMMKLPMLMVDAGNIAKNVRQQLGAVMIEDPIARRKRITSLKRRPWFLRRRKTGRVCVIKPLHASEIIARQ